MIKSARWTIPFVIACLLVHWIATYKPNKNRLVLFGWPNCFSADVLHDFEKEFHCEVVYSLFENNESMYAKTKNSIDDYDIVFCSSYFIELMHEQGLIMQLNRSRLKNLSYIDESYLEFSPDPAMTYSIPQIIGILGIGFDEKKVSSVPDSWFVFSKWKQFKGRMTLLDDPKDVIGSALLSLGYEHNSTNQDELQQAGDLILDWKRNIATFSNEPYIGLESGEFVVCQAYLGEILKTKRVNNDINFVVPKEGSSITFDNLVILKRCKKKNLAHAFIDFLLRPENTARNVEFHCGFVPHKKLGCYVDPKFIQTFNLHYSKSVGKNRHPTVSWLRENEKFYLSTWERILSDIS
ncbi:polyamine ABC transporter substrate-binding protein [Candidatus Similichlamydia epinepheli]|uniref:polyamine ABC transporter substrate-binding protein n=1 Tax=Candidatus Similichlamydia epinepheli TaxID=1903953 RepID=UPI000D3B2BD4|nr:spermidine/putrescine ABC transporter substrate-binding protein [Candidatus Similichlamydia epinepheli]